MPHGNHMFKISSDMAMTTMCAYPSSKYALPHWKFVLRCCAQFPCIYLQSPESDQHNSNVSPTISFHVYNLIACCTVHVRHHYKNQQCHMCEAFYDLIVTTNDILERRL